MTDPTPARMRRNALIGDGLIAVMVMLAVLALTPSGVLSEVALGVLTAVLIVWPVGILVWLARRWARMRDIGFVLLVLVLIATAAGSTILAIITR